MCDETAIRFDKASMAFRIKADGFPGLKSLILHFPRYLRSARQRRSFLALKEVSFEVGKGETFGIIGRNGSGKSTTLGLIAGVLRVTSGTVEVRGRVSPFLELGAGFHPELSGKENIILNGVLLGLTKKQVMEKLDEIATFSELGDFIRQPVRTYSSGMVARLGFSVVAHLSPEILLVDEVLAVGDEAFQRKCLKKMEEFRSAGTTMVFVSHNLAAVESICDRVALLDAGCLVDVGPPSVVISEYLRVLDTGTGVLRG